MRVRPAGEAQSVACTFCQSKVSVPSQEQARREQAAKGPLPVPVVEEYAVAAQPAAWPPQPPPRLSRLEKTRAERAKGDDIVALECSTCHEPIRAKVGLTPGQIACPFCETLVAVPDQKTVAGWRAKKVEPRSRKEIGEYAAGAPVATLPLRAESVFDKLAEVRREVAPPPPRWTFFSGVFTFPWRQGVRLRWAYMAVGFTAMALIGIVLKWLVASLAGMSGGVAIAFFTLPIIWVTMMTVSYSAACCLAVLESTSAGLDQVEAWPEPVWKEWMAQMIYLGWIGAIPFAASYGLAQLAGLGGADVRFAFHGFFFFLYPIALMSALEANNYWVPLTLPIVASLFRWWWAWLLFYLLAGLISAGLIAILVFALQSGQDGLLAALGPLTAAAALIYFRLLGRLAWRMTTKKRRKAESPVKESPVKK